VSLEKNGAKSLILLDVKNIKNSEKRELESPLPLELLSIQSFSTVRKEVDRKPAEKQT
jgi:hypothetical protein